MDKHTKEPWKSIFNSISGARISGAGKLIAEFFHKHDRDRAIACVNALAGVPNEALEAGAFLRLVDALEVYIDYVDQQDRPYRIVPEGRIKDAKQALAALKPSPEESG